MGRGERTRCQQAREIRTKDLASFPESRDALLRSCVEEDIGDTLKNTTRIADSAECKAVLRVEKKRYTNVCGSTTNSQIPFTVKHMRWHGGVMYGS